jgi:hypothetical protein
MSSRTCNGKVVLQSYLITTLADARLAQSVERKALNLVVVGSSPTVGVMLRLDSYGACVLSVRLRLTEE